MKTNIIISTKRPEVTASDIEIAKEMINRKHGFCAYMPLATENGLTVWALFASTNKTYPKKF